MKDQNIIDTEYTEVDQEPNTSSENKKIINGEPLFYTTTQVSQMVGEEPSTIRYWTKRFDSLLNIEISNKNRQYKKSDVEKLKFIKKLAKEDGLTLQQIEDYCSSKGFDINTIEKGIIDSSNPIALQAFISASTVEMDKKLNVFAENLLEQIDNKIKTYLVLQAEENITAIEKIREEVVITVDEVVSEKMEENLTNIKNHIDEKQEESLKIQEENKQILEQVVVNINEMKETDKRLRELLDDPEALKKAIKSIKKENDGFLNRIKNKFK